MIRNQDEHNWGAVPGAWLLAIPKMLPVKADTGD